MSTSQPPNKPRKRRTDRLIGATLAGKYRILKKIGEGGMGSVYTALQDPIDRKVAIKVLLGALAGDDVAVRRFEQEARAISKMQHPNTVTIYDFGRTETDDEERLYIVMEYLKGRTLTQVLRADGVIPPPRACRIVRQVCASLADAHAAGIIHRDLKPDNIFLTEVGGDPDWVKVLDFGVAKLADSEGAGTLTQTGMIFGTPKYMSPEQAEGRPIDHRADIYAMGVVLYELLVGKPPFVADTPVGLLLKHISEPPKPFAEVRPDLRIDPRIEALVMRSLAKKPDGRPQRVVELGLELEAFERRPSGLTPAIASGTYPTPLNPGMPTEVDPGTLPGAAGTPPHLAPPQAVPPGLSDGLVLGPPRGTAGLARGPQAAARGQPVTESEPAGFQSADLLPTSLRGPAESSSGLTHPTPSGGGGIETLGGEISGPLPSTRRRSATSGLRLAGLVLLGLGGALAIVLAVSRDEAPVPVATATPPPADPTAETAPVQEEEPPVSLPRSKPPPEAASERAAQFSSRRPRSESSRRRPAAPPPTAAKAAKSTIELRFESEPPKALVRLGKDQVGETPFVAPFPRGDDVLIFSFSKDGFVTKKETATTLRNRTISVKLSPAADEEPKKPPRAPRPKREEPGEKPPSDPTQERVGELKGF